MIMFYGKILPMAHIDYKLTEASERILGIINANRADILETFRSSPDSIPQVFMGRMIVFPDFAHYAARYFEQGPVMENAMGFLQEKGYAPPYQKPDGEIIFSRTINRFADDFHTPHKNTDGVRSSQSYVLEKAELEQAREFIADNPSFHVSIAAMQGCLASYMDDLVEELRQVAAVNNDLDLLYITANIDNEFTKNTNSDSFLRDMSPLIALVLSENGKEFNPEVLRDPGILRSFFERHAFKSSAYFPGNVPDARRCPFAPNFAEVMSIRFDENADGSLAAEKGRFGDTLAYLISKIELTPDQRAGVLKTIKPVHC